MLSNKKTIGNLEKSTSSGVGLEENQRRNDGSEYRQVLERFCYKKEYFAWK